MRRYQRGVTTIGWLLLLIPVGIVFYAGIRLAPIYLNYMKVVHTFEQIASEIPGDTATADGIRLSLGKHFDVESVDFPDVKDVKIKRINGVWQLEADYDDQAPLFANLFILVTFDKIVKLKGGGSNE